MSSGELTTLTTCAGTEPAAREFVHDLTQLPRLFPRVLRADAAGYRAARRDWENRSRGYGVFVFVIQGWGMCRTEGMEQSVTGPCILSLKPGIPYAYGPFAQWEEFFVAYAPDAWRKLEDSLGQRLDAPVRPLDSADALIEARGLLSDLERGIGALGVADRIDRLFETLLFDLESAALANRAPERDERLQAARAWLEGHVGENPGIETAARQFGFSPTTFRRLWRERFGGTPAAFVYRLRLDAARALIEGTDMPIAEISARLGLGAPGYFADWFRGKTGAPPHVFREQATARSSIPA